MEIGEDYEFRDYFGKVLKKKAPSNKWKDPEDTKKTKRKKDDEDKGGKGGGGGAGGKKQKSIAELWGEKG